MNPLIQFKTVTPLFIVALLLACFGLLPAAQAVLPPPDGGYPNFTTAEGDNALKALTTGVGNTAIGTFSLFSVTNGNFNTAVGAGSLDLNLGDSNTATGAAALLFNTTGTNNTAVGTAALEFNDTGNFNDAVGAFALFSNTTGNNNTASGFKALFSNTTGHENTANGLQALLNNTTGTNNTANGRDALLNNTTGSNNTATGFQALFNNDADGNTANGFDALTANTTGSNNTAIGFQALTANTTGNTNTAIGPGALLSNTTGSSNKALGFNAGSNVTTANNVIAIGTAGANVSDTTWIDNVFGVTTVSGTTAAVIVSNTGQLGTLGSSERFKKDIAAMEKASEAILSLRPVTFHYRADAENTPQFGLIAEEVAKVNPALVLPDKEGKPYSVRYDQVNAMLLNEFLKEHRKVQELEANAARQQKQIEALTAGLQKVSSQLAKASPSDGGLELSESAPQMALNNH
jgi:trimeric autotransporter adhesin